MIRALAMLCRAAREGSDVSYAAVAAKADVSESTVRSFERGDRWPQNVEGLVAAYADATGESVKALWRDSAAMLG
jgi:DNA-binding transcriptional regulator YiaG